MSVIQISENEVYREKLDKEYGNTVKFYNEGMNACLNMLYSYYCAKVRFNYVYFNRFKHNNKRSHKKSHSIRICSNRHSYFRVRWERDDYNKR